MHDGHHADAHELRLEGGAKLLLVVLLDGGDDGTGFVLGAHGWGLNVLEGFKIYIFGLVG